MTPTDPQIEILWKNVLDRWSDDKAHALFLEYCAQVDQLVVAATCYRGMTGDRERGKDANRWLEKVTALALSKLDLSRSQRPDRAASPSTAWVMIAFFVLGTLGLLLYAFGI